MRVLGFVLVLVLMAVGGCDATTSPPAGAPGVTATEGNTAMTQSDGFDPSTMTEEQWRKRLTAQQYYVLRQKGTEAPFTNQYDKHFEEGTYHCAACDTALFDSETKFNSGCGWPAFYAAKAGDRVKLTPDYSHGMIRTEVTCATCGSHLGHIFDDAPKTPTGQRYCINSVSLVFKPK